MNKCIDTIYEKSNGYDGECNLTAILKIDLMGENSTEIKNDIDEKISKYLSEICENHKTKKGRVLSPIHSISVYRNHIILYILFMPFSDRSNDDSYNDWENQAIGILADLSQMLCHYGIIELYKLPVVQNKKIRIIWK